MAQHIPHHPPTTTPSDVARRALAPGSSEPTPKRAGRKTNDRRTRTGGAAGEISRPAPMRSFRKQDLAFQNAMMRAIASGRETPPMIGTFKDSRRFDAPRLFEPVPQSSGCTSPGLVCAELIADADPLVGFSAATGRSPPHPAETDGK
jgi:hypothetical protein